MLESIETYDVILVYEDGREESDEFAFPEGHLDWSREQHFTELAQEEGAVTWRYADD